MTVDSCKAYIIMLILMTLNLTLTLKAFVRLVLLGVSFMLQEETHISHGIDVDSEHLVNHGHVRENIPVG